MYECVKYLGDHNVGCVRVIRDAAQLESEARLLSDKLAQIRAEMETVEAETRQADAEREWQAAVVARLEAGPGLVQPLSCHCYTQHSRQTATFTDTRLSKQINSLQWAQVTLAE